MKKLKNILTDYWVGTITGAILIATALQMIISTLSTFFPQLVGNSEGFGPSLGDYLMPQVYGGILAILIGLIFLAIRNPKP